MAFNMLDSLQSEVVVLVQESLNEILSLLSECSDEEADLFDSRWKEQIDSQLLRLDKHETCFIELIEAILRVPLFWSEFVIEQETKDDANKVIYQLVDTLYRKFALENQSPLSSNTRLYLIFFFSIEQEHARNTYNITASYRRIRHIRRELKKLTDEAKRNERLVEVLNKLQADSIRDPEQEKLTDKDKRAELVDELNKLRADLKSYVARVNVYAQLSKVFPRKKVYPENSLYTLYQFIRTIRKRPIYLEYYTYLNERLETVISQTPLSPEFKLKRHLLTYFIKEISAVHNDILREMPEEIQESFKTDAANIYENNERLCETYFKSLLILQDLFKIKEFFDEAIRENRSSREVINMLHEYKTQQKEEDIIEMLGNLEAFLDDSHTNITTYAMHSTAISELIRENFMSLNPQQAKKNTPSKEFEQFKTRMENYLGTLLKIYSALEKIIDLTLSSRNLDHMKEESLKILSADSWDNQFALMIARIREFIIITISSNSINPVHSKVSALTRSLERTSPDHLVSRAHAYFKSPSPKSPSIPSDDSDEEAYTIGPSKSTIASPRPAAAGDVDITEALRSALNIGGEEDEDYKQRTPGSKA